MISFLLKALNLSFLKWSLEVDVVRRSRKTCLLTFQWKLPSQAINQMETEAEGWAGNRERVYEKRDPLACIQSRLKVGCKQGGNQAATNYRFWSFSFFLSLSLKRFLNIQKIIHHLVFARNLHAKGIIQGLKNARPTQQIIHKAFEHVSQEVV